jgi:hypothetical protein
MFKKLKSWHLSILVGVASLLSLIFVQQYVLAQWTEPVEVPGGSRVTHLVVNPMTEDLNLSNNGVYYGIFGGPAENNVSIDPTNTGLSTGIIKVKAAADNYAGYFEGNVKVTGNLEVGTITGGGASSLWTKVSDSQIYYNGNPTSNVGIGTSTPVHSLDIVKTSGNPEITLNAFSGNNLHWGIYHDRISDQLRFWHGTGDKIIIKPDGQVGISNPDPTYALDVSKIITTDDYAARFKGGALVSSYDTTTADPAKLVFKTGDKSPWTVYQNNSDSQFRIGTSAGTKLSISPSGAVGIGTTDGYYRLTVRKGMANESYGAGFYGGVMLENVDFNGDGDVYDEGETSYFRLAHTYNAPAASACTDSLIDKGKMVFDYGTGKIWICSCSAGSCAPPYPKWMSLTLQ